MVGALVEVVNVGTREVGGGHAQDGAEGACGDPLLGLLDLREEHLLHLVEDQRIEWQGLRRHLSPNEREVDDGVGDPTGRC